MIYAVLPLTSSHVTGAYFNKRYVVLVIPRKSAHCLPKLTFLKEELCFAKKPGACQTRKMLLLVPERKQYVCGYKITCLHGKNVEIIGQTTVFCFQKWEATFVNLAGLKTEVSEDRTSCSWWQIFLLTYRKKRLRSQLCFLCYFIQSKLYFSLSWIWYCRYFGPAKLSLKQFSGYKCVMITVVNFCDPLTLMTWLLCYLACEVKQMKSCVNYSSTRESLSLLLCFKFVDTFAQTNWF